MFGDDDDLVADLIADPVDSSTGLADVVGAATGPVDPALDISPGAGALTAPTFDDGGVPYIQDPAAASGPVAPADGAFYLWAGIADRLGPHPGSPQWCRALLDEAGVALVPGTDMDPVDGSTYVRLSFAAGADAVDEAVDRIVAWQAGHP